jgi:hypothetical protein
VLIKLRILKLLWFLLNILNMDILRIVLEMVEMGVEKEFIIAFEE